METKHYNVGDPVKTKDGKEGKIKQVLINEQLCTIELSENSLKPTIDKDGITWYPETPCYTIIKHGDIL